METEMTKKNAVLNAARTIGMLLLLSALTVGLRCAIILPRFLH